MPMVIYDGDGRFWSRVWGWTRSLDGADRFTTEQARTRQALPMAETRPARHGRNSAQWLAESDARIIAARNREAPTNG